MESNSIFLQFPSPPRRSHWTIFEQEGELRDVPESRSIPVSSLPDYPEVSTQIDPLGRNTAHCESAQLAFLPHEQTSWKRFLHAWYGRGLQGMLEEICNDRSEVPPFVSTCSNIALTILQKLQTLKSSLFPQMSMTTEDILSTFTHVSNWHRSPVQAIAWHPETVKLAVALRDDSVRIHYPGNALCPVLKHRLQKNVADLGWKTLSSSILALACDTCVLIWHVEPTSLAVRPSSSSVQVLQSRNHSPVTCLAWSPDGNLLVSASPKHTSIMVWDVPLEVGIALKRNRGGGVPLLAFSPDGSKLFTATVSPLFRMWETRNWHWEVWSQLSGRCKAACWSPDSSVLVFSMEGEHALYGVRFTKSGRDIGSDSLDTCGTSVLLADVSEVCVSTATDQDIRFGGEVKSIVWDKTGERIAVMFEPNEHGNNHLIAVFKVTIHPVLELLPGGFVKGKSGESVHHISFERNYKKGALLTVVWSSGRLGYVPMNFVPAKQIQRQHEQFNFAHTSWSPLSTKLSPTGRFHTSYR